MNTHTKKADTELKKELASKREALRVFRFGGSGSKQKNVKEGAVLRKEIARILTEINSREKNAA